VYSEGICHCDIRHVPLSFWGQRSVTSSPKDDRPRIRYGLSGTSTREPLNVNDPIYTYIPRYIFHTLYNPIFLLLPLHSSLLSIYVRVHIVNSYDHFHVYTVLYTMDLGLVCHVNCCRESFGDCACSKFKWYVRVVCVNGEWSVNCVRRHPLTVCLWGRSNQITTGSRWYATENFLFTSV